MAVSFVSILPLHCSATLHVGKETQYVSKPLADILQTGCFDRLMMVDQHLHVKNDIKHFRNTENWVESLELKGDSQIFIRMKRGVGFRSKNAKPLR